MNTYLILIIVLVIFALLFIKNPNYNSVSTEYYTYGQCSDNPMNSCSPTSGYEPIFDPGAWNNNNFIEDSHNCYAYALNDINDDLAKLCEHGECRYINPQPGHYCGMTKRVNYENTTCEKLDERAKCDNPHMLDSTFDSTCPEGYYKIGLTVNPGKTYHWYRQGKNGYWDHKDGGREANNIDASGNLIIDPQYANRDYTNQDGSNYTEWCKFYCIPSNEHDHTYYARNDYYKDKLHYQAEYSNSVPEQ